MSKLVLIDGHSILNRGFYGVPLLTNTKGMHINAIYGFLSIMFKLLDAEKPDYLIVAFDRKEPTFRHEMYPAYKGTRKPMPEELHEQVPVIKEVLKAMQIVTCEKPGLEADDILGTLAKKAEADGVEVSLVSGDRDLLQIATDRIKIRIPKTKAGGTEVEDYYAKDVLEHYHVDPTTFIELKALMGDTADNIPGVPKVGEKTASSLLVEYGSLDNLYEHVDEITKKSIHDSLVENKDLAYLSKELATIKTDAELPVAYTDGVIGDLYNKEAYDLYISYGFKKFIDRFDTSAMHREARQMNIKNVCDLGECENLFGNIKDNTAIYIDSDTAGITGIALADDECVYTVIPQGFITEEYICDKLLDLAANDRLVCFDIKKNYKYLGVECNAFDMLLAAYLINPLKSDYTIDDIAQEYLEEHIESEKEIFGKISIRDTSFIDTDKTAGYLARRADVLQRTFKAISDKLDELNMRKLYDEIEFPLTKVLFEMEQTGILVDREELTQYGESLTWRINDLEQLIYDQAGEKFNINSPKQLGEIMFEKMGMPGEKKTKTGYSTSADVLSKLEADYPFVKDVLEYRGLVKLKSTYADGLAECIANDGRIHTTFNQTITATGRISSTEPNLQNIPMRMELGRKIRKCFIPKPGYVFIDADYSQIELRLLAHMSGDQELIDAYKTDADIHRITASKVFHVPLEEVTPILRRNAKAVNFGVVYGISSFGLSQDINISRTEAKQYIDDYFETYKGIRKYLDDSVSFARENGYISTMYNRRRPVPELASSNFMTRSFGERIAMNSPIQGTAADIMKIAMIEVAKGLKDAKIDGRIIVQVHDELLLEVKKEDLERAWDILVDRMKNAAKLSVALEVDVHSGNDWYEAK